MVSAATSLTDFVRRSRRRYLMICALACLLFGVFCLDIILGSQGLSLEEFYYGLIQHPDYTRASLIVWKLRMPGACMALLTGMALGISGAQMQTILNNPLADPFTLGISAAAGFGAGLAIVLGKSLSVYLPFIAQYADFIIPLNAFIFSLLTAVFIGSVSGLKRLSSETITLMGIAILFAFNALLTLVEYLASENQLQELIFWMMGSLAKATWMSNAILAGFLLCIVPMILRNAWQLTALRNHEDLARAKGISTQYLRMKILVLVALLTAACVSFVGTIGFVGLVAPHIARMLVGEDQRWFIPATLLIGAIIMSIASLLAKSIIVGVLFPIGVVTALIGIPFFLLLVMQQKQSYWS